MLGQVLVSWRLYRLVALTIFATLMVVLGVAMTSCRIVLNFSPPDRSMRFVTPSGPGVSSSVSLCISAITSFLWMGDSNSGSIGWVRLAISWAILVADDWMERASFSLNGDSLWRNIWWPKAYRNLCHTGKWKALFQLLLTNLFFILFLEQPQLPQTPNGSTSIWKSTTSLKAISRF